MSCAFIFKQIRDCHGYRKGYLFLFNSFLLNPPSGFLLAPRKHKTAHTALAKENLTARAPLLRRASAPVQKRREAQARAANVQDTEKSVTLPSYQQSRPAARLGVQSAVIVKSLSIVTIK